MVKTTYADGSFIEMTYDDRGRKLTETNQMDLTRTFTYDVQGRLASVALPDLDGDPQTTTDIASYQYAYDEFGNQTLLVDPLGRETRWTFDEQGREQSRTLPLGVETTGVPDDFQETFEYDDRGRRTLHVSFEGVVTQSVYDPATDRLSEQRFFDNLTDYDSGNGTPAEVWAYTYDAFGREVEVTQTVGSAVRTVTKTYDAQRRLTEVASPEGTISYTYDDLGRLTSTITGTLSAPIRSTSYTYDDLGRLETVVEDRDATVTTDALLTTTYTYDLLGNLDATESPDDVIDDYEYDELNRLDKITSFVDDGTVNGVYDVGSDTLIASYNYTVQADGRRTGLSETLSSGLTNDYTWVYDNLGRLTSETLDSSDNSLDFQSCRSGFA